MPFCSNCGVEINGDSKFCENCSDTVKEKKQSNASANFFVPIDYSDVREVIPPGEDIIYSTLFYVWGASVQYAGTKYQSFNSHVLFTEKGFVYQNPKRGGMKPHYLPLNRIYLVTPGSMFIRRGFTYSLYYHPDYESSVNFEMRHLKFFLEFAPRLISEKKKKGNSGSLKRLEKLYNRLYTSIGKDGIEFLRTNEDYEAYRNLWDEKLRDFMITSPKWARASIYMKRYIYNEEYKELINSAIEHMRDKRLQS